MYYYYMLNFQCFSLFKKDYDTLVKEAKSGNNKSLYKLLEVDKNIVNEDWVRNRYNESVQKLESKPRDKRNREEIFFIKYGEAIAKMPRFNKTTELREQFYICIRNGGIDNIKTREFNEWLDFLNEMGMIDEENTDKIWDYNAMKQFLYRLKNEILKNS